MSVILTDDISDITDLDALRSIIRKYEEQLIEQARMMQEAVKLITYQAEHIAVLEQQIVEDNNLMRHMAVIQRRATAN